MDPFLGEIRLFAFGFAPKNWAACDGQLLPINQNQALFALLGTAYGGDGRRTFALPDLRGRVPLHRGQAPGGADHPLGEAGGEEAHTLTVAELPRHTHTASANGGPATRSAPGGRVWAVSQRKIYADAPTTAMDPDAISAAGEDLPHSSMQPFLGLQFCIALSGIFPSRD